MKRYKIRGAILEKKNSIKDFSDDLGDTKFVIVIIFRVSWASLLLTFLI